MNAVPQTLASHARYEASMARIADIDAEQEWRDNRNTDRAVLEINAIKSVDLSPRVVSILLARIRDRVAGSGWQRKPLAVAARESIGDACVALDELNEVNKTEE